MFAKHIDQIKLDYIDEQTGLTPQQKEEAKKKIAKETYEKILADPEMKENIEKLDAEEAKNKQLVPTDENGQIVEVEPEIHEVDKLLAVKNWAMQSPDWKLFNVIFESMNEKQL